MRKFGLIGFPLGHSFSKKFFSEKFEYEYIDARYDLYELTNIGEFQNLRKSVELSGLNVTIPYKEQVIPLLDRLDDTAAHIGAVNVIRFDYDKNGTATLTGFNTDAVGFENSLKPFLKSYHKKR